MCAANVYFVYRKLLNERNQHIRKNNVLTASGRMIAVEWLPLWSMCVCVSGSCIKPKTCIKQFKNAIICILCKYFACLDGCHKAHSHLYKCLFYYPESIRYFCCCIYVCIIFNIFLFYILLYGKMLYNNPLFIKISMHLTKHWNVRTIYNNYNITKP